MGSESASNSGFRSVQGSSIDVKPTRKSQCSYCVYRTLNVLQSVTIFPGLGPRFE